MTTPVTAIYAAPGAILVGSVCGGVSQGRFYGTLGTWSALTGMALTLFVLNRKRRTRF